MAKRNSNGCHGRCVDLADTVPAADYLAHEALKRFSQTTEARPEGSVLFEEGAAPTGVFLLRAGRVKLSVSSRKGKTVLLQVASPGEFLGLGAVLAGRPYEMTAQTVSPAEVVFAPREEFIRFLRERPPVCLEVIRLLSYELIAAYERVRTLRR